MSIGSRGKKQDGEALRIRGAGGMAGYEEDSETECPGFSWDRDDFLYSVWHDAVFLLQEKNILIKQQYFSCC